MEGNAGAVGDIANQAPALDIPGLIAEIRRTARLDLAEDDPFIVTAALIARYMHAAYAKNVPEIAGAAAAKAARLELALAINAVDNQLTARVNEALEAFQGTIADHFDNQPAAVSRVASWVNKRAATMRAVGSALLLLFAAIGVGVMAVFAFHFL